MTERSEVYWFRLPDDEAFLMSLKPAELKCYLVVSRAIQRDRNAGFISERQVSKRSGVSLRHVQAALDRLVGMGRLLREGETGKTATYYLPHSWKTGNCIPTGEQSGESQPTNRIPTGKQLTGECVPVGKHQRIPTGKQNCIPTGEQHLELVELSEKTKPPAALVSLANAPHKRPKAAEQVAIDTTAQYLWLHHREHLRGTMKELPGHLLNVLSQRTGSPVATVMEFVRSQHQRWSKSSMWEAGRTHHLAKWLRDGIWETDPPRDAGQLPARSPVRESRLPVWNDDDPMKKYRELRPDGTTAPRPIERIYPEFPK